MPITNWEITREEHDLLVQVADRALKELTGYPDDKRTLVMDLNACHSNACKLDFAGLLAAPMQDFSHDIYGVRTHINRQTGVLDDNGGPFMPRYALANRVPTQPQWFLIDGEEYTQEEVDLFLKKNLIEPCSGGQDDETACRDHYHALEGIGEAGLLVTLERAGLGPRKGAAIKTIDITPAGCQTPEGAARVAAAMKVWGDCHAEVANKAVQFLRELLPKVQIPNDLADDLKELTTAIKRRVTAQEEFLRAVAGAPPAVPQVEPVPASQDNNYCNGSGPHTPGEVRVMPTGGGGNDLLCRSCWQQALTYRQERNRSIRYPVAQAFDLLPWESAKVYEPGE